MVKEMVLKNGRIKNINSGKTSFFSCVDIAESKIIKNYPGVLDLLLKDETTKKSIIWATQDYKSINSFFDGLDFYQRDERDSIDSKDVAKDFIKPRCIKSIEQQKSRTREKAEVFTPAWICNKQNNLLDEEWFGRKQVFNKERSGGIARKNSWKSLTPEMCKSAFDSVGRIAFPRGKTWQDYVQLIRMEVACGEAPYLVSRYDSTNSRQKKPMALISRIGLLDRKLRIIYENTDSVEDFFEWSKKAFQSIYAFEFQGDNLLLARENLLFTFYDFYLAKFSKEPSLSQMLEIAEIIAWNIFQMDGLKLVIPFSCHDEIYSGKQPELISIDAIEMKIPCKGCAKNDVNSHNGIYCKIKDWETGEILEFRKAFSNAKN